MTGAGVNRAIVVGGGICGVSCAGELDAGGWSVELRDRGSRLGGRMASRRLHGTGTSFDGRVVDIGASYFTVSDADFARVVTALVDRGVVRPWTTSFHVAGPDGIEGVRSGPMRYAAPLGLRSVVEAMADSLAGATIATGAEVRAVTVAGSGIEVDGDPADAVALCMPAPQAVRVAPEVPPVRHPWEPVIVLTCVYDRRHWIDLDGVFVNDDPVLTWIADDGSRRGDGAPVLVAHVNPVLAARHLDDPTAVVPAALSAIQRVLGISARPDWFDVHRWTFAKPLVGEEAPFWMLGTVPLGQAGDAWSGGPRVEAAWLSGRALGRALSVRGSA